MSRLQQSRALWNRSRLDLRGRVRRLVLTVPVPLPHFWLAALRAAGEDVDVGAETPRYDSGI